MARKTLAISVRHHGGYGARRHLYGRRFVGCLVQLGLLPTPDEAVPYPEGIQEHHDDSEGEDDGGYSVDRGVLDYARHLVQGRRRRGEIAVVVSFPELGGLSEESELGVGREYLIVARQKRIHSVEGQRDQGYPHVLQLAHLDEYRGGDGEGHSGQELVRYTKQREEL